MRKTTVIILQRLQGVLSMEVGSLILMHVARLPFVVTVTTVLIVACCAIQGHIASNDRAQYNDLQSLLCATLQVCLMYHILLIECLIAMCVAML